MKKKKIVIETTYFGNIKRCIHLNKEKNYIYINSEIVDQNRMLLKTTDGKYITGSDYVSKKYALLDINPIREGDLFVDEESLVLANSYLDEDKIKKKSLHL